LLADEGGAMIVPVRLPWNLGYVQVLFASCRSASPTAPLSASHQAC
jgi:hypothetical protein